MRKDFEVQDGMKYPIIWRKKGNSKTDKCPFCKAKHTHGIGEGHRIAHCIDLTTGSVFVDAAKLSDGSYALPRNGYILREY